MRRGLGVAVRALTYLRELVLSEPWSVKRAALAGATALWVGDLACAWAALHAFGVSLPLAPLLLGYGIGFVSNALPLPAGGSGGVDAALTGGFVLAGAPVSAALLGALRSACSTSGCRRPPRCCRRSQPAGSERACARSRGSGGSRPTPRSRRRPCRGPRGPSEVVVAG